MAMLENFDPATIGNFLASPQAPVLLGQAGAAMMGPQQNSWQANLGKVAAGLGQSSIAAGEAKAQGDKSAAMNAWLKQLLPGLMGGVQLTPEGVAGPTDTTAKIGADGTFTVTTKGDTSTKGGNAPAGAPAQGQPPQTTMPNLNKPTQQQPFNPRLLPF